MFLFYSLFALASFFPCLVSEVDGNYVKPCGESETYFFRPRMGAHLDNGEAFAILREGDQVQVSYSKGWDRINKVTYILKSGRLVRMVIAKTPCVINTYSS